MSQSCLLWAIKLRIKLCVGEMQRINGYGTNADRGVTGGGLSSLSFEKYWEDRGSGLAEGEKLGCD